MEAARDLRDGYSDKSAIQEGLPLAISIYMRSEQALPAAVDLVR